MGQSTDWFIAKPSNAQKLLESEHPFDEFPSLSLKGILTLEILHLTRILVEDDYNPRLLVQVSEDGPFVFEEPDRLITSLSGLDAERRSEIASAWKNSSEHLREWTIGDLEDALSKMSAFAEQAARQKTSVLALVAV